MPEWVSKYWIEFVFGLITTVMGFVIKKLNRKISEQEAIKMGVQALLRDRILQAYNHHMERGFCPIYARENIQQLAEQYHNLGGNGVIDELLEKMKCLPTERPKEDLDV